MSTLTQDAPTGLTYYEVPALRETPAARLGHGIGSSVVTHFEAFDATDVTPSHQRLLIRGDRLLAATTRIADLRLIFDPTPSVFERVGQFLAARTLPASDPPAYQAFKALGRLLNADDHQIAEMVGIGRTTPYTWKRDGREPRARSSQRIYEYQATIDALRRRLGAEQFRDWLSEGITPRRDVLLAGGLESLDAEVHQVLFRRAPSQRVDLSAAPEDVAPLGEVSRGRDLRPSRRRPRR